MKKNFQLVAAFIFIFLNTTAQSFQTGDLFVGVAKGKVQWRSSTGVLIDTISTGFSSSLTLGIAFDKNQEMYVVNYEGNAVSNFDNQGSLLGLMGSGYDFPESIILDSSGNIFISNIISGGIMKFSSSGSYLTSYFESGGRVDWMDLANDQCTLLFTQEGTSIRRINVCTNNLLSDFATNLNGVAYALRLRPNGEVLLANKDSILRLSASGTMLQSYNVPGENSWFAINLNPDGTSFWSANFNSSNVYKFDIATGSVLDSFNTGTPINTVFGLAVLGELTVAVPSALHDQTAIANEVQVYPQPTTGEFIVRIKNNYTPNGRAELFNVFGEKVLESALLPNKTSLRINDPVAGIYLLKIQIGEKHYSRKVLIN